MHSCIQRYGASAGVLLNYWSHSRTNLALSLSSCLDRWCQNTIVDIDIYYPWGRWSVGPDNTCVNFYRENKNTTVEESEPKDPQHWLIHDLSPYRSTESPPTWATQWLLITRGSTLSTCSCTTPGKKSGASKWPARRSTLTWSLHASDVASSTVALV